MQIGCGSVALSSATQEHRWQAVCSGHHSVRVHALLPGSSLRSGVRTPLLFPSLRTGTMHSTSPLTFARVCRHACPLTWGPCDQSGAPRRGSAVRAGECAAANANGCQYNEGNSTEVEGKAMTAQCCSMQSGVCCLRQTFSNLANIAAQCQKLASIKQLHMQQHECNRCNHSHPPPQNTPPPPPPSCPACNAVTCGTDLPN